jgi:hypothetical protein
MLDGDEESTRVPSIRRLDRERAAVVWADQAV